MRKTLLAGLAVAASPAARPRLRPVGAGGLRHGPPGVMTFTDGAQCTSNFIFTDSAGGVYIGQAAHCSGTGGQTDTDGCLTQSLPNGTPVEVTGASQPGDAGLQLAGRRCSRRARPTPTPAPTTTSR